MNSTPRIVAMVLLLAVAWPARADEDDEKVGELQPVTPTGQYHIPNFQNYGHSDFGYALAPDGKSVVVGSHGNFLLVYDLMRRKEMQQPKQLMLEEQMNLFNTQLAFV